MQKTLNNHADVETNTIITFHLLLTNISFQKMTINQLTKQPSSSPDEADGI